MSFFKKKTSQLLHLFQARNSCGFGVHSPSLYRFIRFVVYEKKPYYVFFNIEKLREQQFWSYRSTNPLHQIISKIKLKFLYHRQIKRHKKHEQLLYRMIAHYRPSCILEFGTELGISTLYLASYSSSARCILLETDEKERLLAEKTIRQSNCRNILYVSDPKNIENLYFSNKTYPEFVVFHAGRNEKDINFLLKICLSHTKNNTIFVIEDIHNDLVNRKIWKTLKTNPQVTSTIDSYFWGIIYFNTDLHNKHYKLRY